MHHEQQEQLPAAIGLCSRPAIAAIRGAIYNAMHETWILGVVRLGIGQN